MRFFLLNLFLVCFVLCAYPDAKTDSLLSQLKMELAKKRFYDGQKQRRIEELKKNLSVTRKDDNKAKYVLCTKLYEEYKVFQFDSAYVYTQKLISLSKASHNLSQLYESKIKLGFILLSSGMFTETFECLNEINIHVLTDSSKIQYYGLKARAYSDLAEYNNDKYYTQFDNNESIKYLDSSIAFSKPNSFDKLMHMGDRQLRIGDLQKPSPYYLQLLKQNISSHQRAMVVTGLSFFFSGPFQKEARIRLLALGAINDIRSSTKETLAIFKLGEQLYLDGNLNDSYIFIQQAMDDAQFYGARLRKLKIAAILPLIDAQKIITTENEKNRFLIYLVSIAAIAILIALISFIVFIQLKRLKAKEAIIEEKNVQLEKINDKLSEDAKIKEEYIGYFFNVISSYILKLEKLKRNIERKITIKKYDDILLSINEINIKKERETLFYTFDHIFLKLFPNFITGFNSLLKKEDQIWPKDNEVLNTDLRIFALMRLGINDNETIANILEYSVSTIYVYKMRIKAKALVHSDQFDSKIMAIKVVDVINKP